MNPFTRNPVLTLASVCIFLASAVAAFANDEWRTWTSSAGTKIEARLVSQDSDQVTLERKDGKQLVVKPSQLSQADQEFLAAEEAPEAPQEVKGKTTVEGVPAEPGIVSKPIFHSIDPNWSYLLYLPKDFHTGRKWPVCFVMDPGGGGEGTLNRYIPAAEHLGIILAVSVQSKNGFRDSDTAATAMSGDVYARLPVIEELAIASGMSGGSRMAYLLAELDENIAGVLACGSGDGVYLSDDSFRQAKLRRNTAVCSLIGSNDFNRREAVKAHKGFGKDDRIIWFVGNHDWANEDLIMEGMADVYGRMLLRSKASGLEPLQIEFSKSQLARAKELQGTQPWLALRWAEFLAKFPGDDDVKSEAASLASTLEKDAAVTKAAKAEKAIEDFADKYFADGKTKEDNAPDASREQAAAKKAAEFQGLPQAEVLERMGKPSPPP